mgnify:CR=1 FL=1
MGRLISSFVLVSLVGAALAFSTVEHSREVQSRIDQSREFYSKALGVVLPEGYSTLVSGMRIPGVTTEEPCLTIEVEQIEKVLQRIEHNRVATLSGTPVSMPDGKQLILLQDPNGVLIEVVGS